MERTTEGLRRTRPREWTRRCVTGTSLSGSTKRRVHQMVHQTFSAASVDSTDVLSSFLHFPLPFARKRRRRKGSTGVPRSVPQKAGQPIRDKVDLYQFDQRAGQIRLRRYEFEIP